MRLYHFLNREFGLDDLKQRRLKIATFDQLNDPFEMLAVASNEANERLAFRKMRDEMAKKRGLLCFSRAWTNPVQWSHYSDCHRGLCLGFDVPDEFAKMVEYRSKRLKVDVAILKAGNADGHKFLERLIRTKFNHWRYEDEVRAFVDLEEREGQYWFKPFDEDLVLREVIVGVSSDISRSEVQEALGAFDIGVTVCKARLAFQTFSIVRQNRSTPWA